VGVVSPSTTTECWKVSASRNAADSVGADEASVNELAFVDGVIGRLAALAGAAKNMVAKSATNDEVTIIPDRASTGHLQL
jgi:hypothetical protein